MDLELLQFRSRTIQAVRNFFIEKNYLEVDTPALSGDLIPETCLEVFKTEYFEPWNEKRCELFLVPSPEIYIKKLIAQHKVSIFQLSKCYRNVESVGNLHSPEFTMLEYYTMGADYKDSLKITEELFEYLQKKLKIESKTIGFSPFTKVTMNEAFEKLANFSLDDCPNASDLEKQAIKMGLNPKKGENWADLFEMIFVHKIEPNLKNLTNPAGLPVFLCDYPAAVRCLAQNVKNEANSSPIQYKERWELYVNGIELANCYSEERDAEKIKEYFLIEGNEKNEQARIRHKIDENYWKFFNNFPKCSGVAIGVDRLIMSLLEKKTINSVLPFPLEVKESF